VAKHADQRRNKQQHGKRVKNNAVPGHDSRKVKLHPFFKRERRKQRMDAEICQPKYNQQIIPFIDQ
jgi:hypothetical protein